MGSVRHSLTSSPQGLYETSATRLAPLGTILEVGDGREFVYGSAGAVALEQGRLCQSALVVSGHASIGRAVDAPLVGTRTIAVTTATTLVSENQYAEGYLCIVNQVTGGATTGASVGSTYKISGNTAAATAGATTVTIVDTFWVGIDASATVQLIQHPCQGALIHASPMTRSLVGVPIRDIAANEYGWFQRKGIATVLQDGTLVNGNPVVNSDSVDGAVAALTITASAADEFMVGSCHEFSATGDFAAINLNIG